MIKKLVLWICVVITLMVVILVYMSFVYTYPRNDYKFLMREKVNTFYRLPKNTVDVVFIGSSGVDRYWMPPAAWHETGVATFDLSAARIPFVFTKYLMEEAEKYQQPKIYVVDVRRAKEEPDTVREGDIRIITDTLKISDNRIEATKAALQYASKGDNLIDPSDPTYFTGSLYYFFNRKDIGLEDFIDLFPTTEYMGCFAYSDSTFMTEPQKIPKITKEKAPIHPATEEVINDLLDYCDQLDAEVIFVSGPHAPKVSRQTRNNYVLDLMEQRGYKTINFNSQQMYQTLDLDFNKDFYNDRHVNMRGALKYTSYLGEYLQETYNLENHNGDPKYKAWDMSYEAFVKRINKKWPGYYETYLKGKME